MVLSIYLEKTYLNTTIPISAIPPFSINAMYVFIIKVKEISFTKYKHTLNTYKY